MSPLVAFRKLQGAGNDFIFIDARNEEVIAIADRPKFSQKISDRHFGVGADGVVFVETDTDLNLRWDFYNSDGSFAEMCGNAARCFVRWAEQTDGLKQIEFITKAGKVVGRVVEHQIRVELAFVDRKFKQIQKSSPLAHLVNSGVPHIVIELATGTDFPQMRLHRQQIDSYRWNKEAGERGANVTLFLRTPRGIRTLTFERGVEDFTLACGTGVMAAAIVTAAGSMSPVEVEAPGGLFRVEFLTPDAGAVLIGAAECVIQGEYFIEGNS